MSKPNKIKRKGKRVVKDRIKAQLRLYPLEEEENTSEDQNKNYVTIKCVQDDTKDGTKDNLIYVELITLKMLELQAEDFLHNYFIIKDAVFDKKNWNSSLYLERRFKKFSQCLKKRALHSFNKATFNARNEILNEFVWDEIGEARIHNINKDREKNEGEFIDFIERVSFLKTEGYLEDNQCIEREDHDPVAGPGEDDEYIWTKSP